MKDDRLLQRLHSKLAAEGYQTRVASLSRLSELREGIDGIHTRGLLNEEFYQERLTHFSFKPPNILPDAESLIVVAVPQPQTRVFFKWQRKLRPVIIPPTYAYETDNIVQGILSDVLGPENYQVTRAALPLKSLAVRSGLGDYGRNSICYVPSMGSFHRLVAFYSNAICPDESWREPQAMRSCENCQACSRGCPTGAIAPDRFLIRAERCITFHNERQGEFPAWIDPSWHNCLVGCMRCQRVCPENAHFLNRVEGNYTFSEEETNCILKSIPSNSLPHETAKKLAKLGLLEDSHLLGRNLAALLRRQEQLP